MKRIFSLVAILLLFCALTAEAAIRVYSLKGTPYVFLRDVAQFYGMSYRVAGREVALRQRDIEIGFSVNSRVMYLNGMQFYLSRPVTDLKGTILLSKSDFTGLLDVALRAPKLPRKDVHTILIDAGHGGKDCGAIVGQVLEKNINLAVAYRVAQALHKAGFQVYMTRLRDKEVGLEERVRMAARVNADLFISLHCNAAKNKVTGLETYIATRTGDCAVGSSVASKSVCPANRYDAQNLYLGHTIHRKILLATGMPDRGLRPFRYYVLRNNSCPAVLVEMGFMTTPSDLAAMRSEERQRKLTAAIVAAVQQYRAASLGLVK